MASGFASENSNFYVSTIQTAILGGAVSEISGGKFSNGAMSAAFVHMFNALNKGINKALNKHKYAKGKQYGDGFKEVAKGTINGAIAIKNAAGALRGAVESTISNIDTVSLDVITTVEVPIYMAEELLENTAETIIDYEKSIKNGTFNWGVGY